MTQPIALLISLAVEVPIVLLLAHPAPYTLNQLLKLVYLACAATLLTHPVAWASNQMLMCHLTFLIRATLIESFVVAVEGILYAQLPYLCWGRGILVSGVANAASFFSGLVIYQLI